MGLGQREVMLIAAHAETGQATAGLAAVAGGVQAVGNAGKNASLRLFGFSNAFSIAGRTLTRFGGAVVGVAGVTAKLSMDYEKGMNLVRTQTDLTDKQFEKLKKSVLELSTETEHSTGTLSEGLYDIFSTVYVNSPQAMKMLEAFSKAATAGVTDIRTVARSAMSAMNAFGLEAKDVTSILDAQFKFVQLGVGTYEEFASVLGKVSPASAAFGQNLHTTVGALAFMTKSGLSAAESTTSVARAMERLGRPETVVNLRKVLGVDIIDKATGEFKDFQVIINDMAVAMDGLSRPERAEVFAEIFGVGEVRARRFFDFAIPNLELFNRVMSETTAKEATDAMTDAFETMRKSTTFEVGVMLNTFKALGIELGNAFLPAIKDVLEVVRGGVEWFQGLSEATRETGARFILTAGVISLVSGLILKLAGGFLRIISIMRLAGIGFASVSTGILSIITVTSLALGALAMLSGNEGFGGVALKIGAGALALTAFITIISRTGPVIKTFGLALKSVLETAYLRFLYLMDAIKKFAIVVQTQGIRAAIVPMITWLKNLSITMVAAGAAFAVVGAAIALVLIDNARRAREFAERTDAISESLLRGEQKWVSYGRSLQDVTAPLFELVRVYGNLDFSLNSVNTMLLRGVEYWAQNRTEISNYIQDALRSVGVTDLNTASILGLARAYSAYRVGLRKATEAVRDQMVALEDQGVEFTKAEGKAVDLALATGNVRGAVRLLTRVEKANQSATQLTAEMWGELAGQAKVSAREIVQASRKKAQAMDDYARDFRKILKAGLPQEMAEQILAMGDRGMGIVKALANANETQFNRIIANWQATEDDATRLTRKVTGVKDAIESIKDHKTKLETDTQPGKDAINDFRKWVEGLKVGVEVQSIGFTTGHTGGKLVGAAEEFPILVKRNEFLVRDSIVNQPGVEEFLHNLNRGNPRALAAIPMPDYHEGGLTGVKGMNHFHNPWDFTKVNAETHALIKAVKEFRASFGGQGTLPVQKYAAAAFATFPGLQNWGIKSVRTIAGTNTWSQHAFGNAIDISKAGYPASLDPLYSWTMARKGMFDIRNVLFRTMTGGNHFNHIHVDFNPPWEGHPVSNPYPLGVSGFASQMHEGGRAELPLWNTGAFARRPTVGTLEPGEAAVPLHTEQGRKEFRSAVKEALGPMGAGNTFNFHQVMPEGKDIVDELEWVYKTRGY